MAAGGGGRAGRRGARASPRAHAGGGRGRARRGASHRRRRRRHCRRRRRRRGWYDLQTILGAAPAPFLRACVGAPESFKRSTRRGLVARRCRAELMPRRRRRWRWRRRATTHQCIPQCRRVRPRRRQGACATAVPTVAAHVADSRSSGDHDGRAADRAPPGAPSTWWPCPQDMLQQEGQRRYRTPGVVAACRDGSGGLAFALEYMKAPSAHAPSMLVERTTRRTFFGGVVRMHVCKADVYTTMTCTGTI